MPAGLTGLDGPRELDRPPEEEELLGERRLSGVRMADDPEGPALVYFVVSSNASVCKLIPFPVSAPPRPEKKPQLPPGVGERILAKIVVFLPHWEAVVKKNRYLVVLWMPRPSPSGNIFQVGSV
jgi:hypothetical protein